MQYKCDKCNDSGSLNKFGPYYDCTSCDAAEQRVALEKWCSETQQRGPSFDDCWAIHQRALAIGLAESVEGMLTEMQPGGALHMPQEPVAHLKYWAAQRWSGCGDHEIEHGEGLEVCEPGEIGADGLPAFPVFMHAIPGALAMAPKQEAPADERAAFIAEFQLNGTMLNSDDAGGFSNPWVAAHWDGWQRRSRFAAPAAANGALTDEQVHQGVMALLGCTSSEVEDYSAKLYEGYANDVRRVHASLAAAGQDAALVKALESALAIINNEANPDEYAAPLKAIRAALSGAKGN